ncbi:hypothetical protein Moror_12470 [Moniliophthora roreri MCA 2997]|uniref:GSKIP domain-containing protein n=1 Tax=Moniliophthora roreri (strain MCA 2997) TaxID=1381753 RepID=V2XSB7_MONRO|nr:hypothetical protein Moror_12470 [Moniliophthora roreri MCA 2997]
MEGSTGSFYRDELRKALSEQRSAIEVYSVLRYTSLDAHASVTLLEGKVIYVILTERGFAIVQGSDWDRTHVFESLEGLLQSASSLYAMEKQRQLFEALERLSNSH